jgi:hypothetical protein
MRPLTGLLTLQLALTGCATVVQLEARPAVAPGGNGFAVDIAMFPECEAAAEFAFAGEATLAALGLGDLAGGPDATRPGMIWVTAGPVAFEVPAGGGKGLQEVPAQRVVCVQWPDGSGMSTTVPDGWELPSGAGDSATPSTAANAEPIDFGPIAVITAVAVLVGASILAFRREDRRSTTGTGPG